MCSGTKACCLWKCAPVLQQGKLSCCICIYRLCVYRERELASVITVFTRKKSEGETNRAAWLGYVYTRRRIHIFQHSIYIAASSSRLSLLLIDTAQLSGLSPMSSSNCYGEDGLSGMYDGDRNKQRGEKVDSCVTRIYSTMSLYKNIYIYIRCKVIGSIWNEVAMGSDYVRM